MDIAKQLHLLFPLLDLPVSSILFLIRRSLTIPLHFDSMTSCATCKQPLVIEVEPDEEDQPDQGNGSTSIEQVHTVPDDVQMNCGCHFHWSVFIDA